MGKFNSTSNEFKQKLSATTETSLNVCDFTPCYHIVPADKLNEQYYLGNIPLGTTSNIVPKVWNECCAMFTSNDGSYNLILKMAFDSNIIVFTKIGSNIPFIKNVFSCKVFAFGFHIQEGNLSAQLFLNKLPLVMFNTTIGNILKMVLTRLLITEIEKDDSRGEEGSNIVERGDLTYFYSELKQVSAQYFIKLDETKVHHPLLIPVLRPYQQEAVRWMIQREKFPEPKEILHPLFEEIQLKSGTTIYFNKYTGFVDNTKPVVSSLRTGGILADDMGLGKTVEVLACILLSTKPTNGIADSTKSSVILTGSRKRKLQNSIHSKSSKRFKLSDVDTNACSKQSSTHVCLDIRCNPSLEETISSNKTQYKAAVHVYCICGTNTISRDVVQCVDCQKFQHATCLKYKRGFGEFRCPNCWLKQPLIESNGTLIVCPAILRIQWCDEIRKHVAPGLQVFVYEGSKATPVYPMQLAEYDIVITTYTVLQSELRLSQSTKIPNLRHIRRYASQGSPLSCVKWWRLCLDEAQIIELPTTRVSIMARKLSAHHRWAITSTPTTNELEGMHGLIDYLQMEPYNDIETWKYLLYLPYMEGKTSPMLNFLAQVMWRSSKEDVFDQTNIPPAIVKEYALQFNAVESFFYRREHTMSTSDFMTNISIDDVHRHSTLKSLDRAQLNSIMGPLTNIRQACSNANTVRGRYLVTRKQVTSMKDLLNALIRKNLNSCEENLCGLIRVLIGLAGISLLGSNPAQAVTEYRKILVLTARFNTDDSREAPVVDKLQHIHTLHNLDAVFKTWPSIKPTVRECSLREDCEKVEKTYIEKYENLSSMALQESKTATQSVMKFEKQFILKPGEWYTKIITWISIHGRLEELKQNILNAACMQNIKIPNLIDEQHICYLISAWTNEITNLRLESHKLLSKIYRLENGQVKLNDELLQAAIYCHIRPKTTKDCCDKCFLCQAGNKIRKYEEKLFPLTDTDTDDNEDVINTDGGTNTWEQLAFKELLSIVKAGKFSDKFTVSDGEVYLSMLDALKYEFKEICIFWTCLNKQIIAVQEINVCKTRMCIRSPEQSTMESTNATNDSEKFINHIEFHELAYKESVLRDEEILCTSELERNIGTYKYLETLREQQYAGKNPDPCPICRNELLGHWSILPCGHSFCMDCIDSLIKRVSAFIRLNVTCSVCRQTFPTIDVSYIRTNVEPEPHANELKIIGDYSTKIEAIVKLIVQLKNNESDVKILVFSTWADVLCIILNALILNNIKSEVLYPHNFKNSLSDFKTPSQNVTALLQPVHLGSKGLNLVEATHVILVEPLLNPNDEVQAVGRAYRIGQTKPVTVHKFYMQNTVEENIHKAISTNREPWSSLNTTLNQVMDLFVMNVPEVS